MSKFRREWLLRIMVAEESSFYCFGKNIDIFQEYIYFFLSQKTNLDIYILYNEKQVLIS